MANVGLVERELDERIPPLRRLRPHTALFILLTVSIALRVVTVLGYPSPVWFGGDSNTYVKASLNLVPSLARPSGYSVFLWLMRPLGSLITVIVVQHLLGLATGVLVYVLVWRLTRRAWLGCLAAAPVLLDAFQIQLEHQLMADGLFIFLVVAAFTIALWRPRPSWKMAAAAGALLACAALCRTVGMPLLVLMALWLVITRTGWRPMAAAVVAFAIPVLGYGFWFQSAHHTFALARADSVWLYGRTADFANCAKMKPRPALQKLCVPKEPDASAAWSVLWGPHSALWKIPHGYTGVEANKLAGEFAWLAIKTQPGDYARVVVRDTFRAFAWGRSPYPNADTMHDYTFAAAADPLTTPESATVQRYDGSPADPHADGPFAGWMTGYQSWAYLPGPLFGVIMLIGLAGMIMRRSLRNPALPLWLSALALLVVPAATADFDYRYVLPAVPLACLAAALAWSRRPDGEDPARPAVPLP